MDVQPPEAQVVGNPAAPPTTVPPLAAAEAAAVVSTTQPKVVHMDAYSATPDRAGLSQAFAALEACASHLATLGMAQMSQQIQQDAASLKAASIDSAAPPKRFEHTLPAPARAAAAPAPTSGEPAPSAAAEQLPGATVSAPTTTQPSAGAAPAAETDCPPDHSETSLRKAVLACLQEEGVPRRPHAAVASSLAGYAYD